MDCYSRKNVVFTGGVSFRQRICSMIQKPRPRLLYQPARPFEPDARRQKVCAKFCGSFWHITEPLDAKSTFKSTEYDDSREPRVDCHQVAESSDGNSTTEDVALRRLTKATPTVYEILYEDALLQGFGDMSSGFRWIHLPFTIKLWVDHLIEAIARFSAHGNSSFPRTDNDSAASEAHSLCDSTGIKRFISETFNETGLVTSYRQPGLVIEDSPGKQTLENRVSLVVCQEIYLSLRISENLMAKLPLIDVDYSITEMRRLKDGNGINAKKDGRNQAHIQAMKELKSCYNDKFCKLHSPRTLDESSYDFLESDDLERRDKSQVLTLYLEGQKALAETESSTPGLRSANTRHGSMLLGPATPKSRDGAMTHSLCKTPKSEKLAVASASTDQRSDDPVRPFPQLWLWKLDEHTIVSAYPARWDPFCGQSMFDKVRKELQICATVDDVTVKIADSCVNYIEDSWYVSKGRAYTTFGAFDYAIAEVSNEVAKSYEEFEASVGSANKNIHLKVRRGADLLKRISDVIDEIEVIKRVLDDQALAMKNVLRWKSQTDGSDGATHKTKYTLYPLERFTRLEQNASSVQNSLITLLDIWQRELIIDDAREESRQSRVLFVFTAVTVCFLPLSFTGQLLALPIRGLGVGDDYGPAWVLEVEVIAMVVTLIVILILFWMCFGLPEYVKSMWTRIPPSAWHQASDENKVPAADNRGRKAEARQCRARVSPLVHPHLRNKTQSRSQSDMENGMIRIWPGV